MSATVRFALPAAVVRGSLDDLRDVLMAALSEGEVVVIDAASVLIDAASVLEVDGPGVQLLLALGKEARDRGVRLELVNRSEALTAALAASRVEGLLP